MLRQKENFVLWDMQGSFKATNYLSFYVRGENLLAQRYEINAGYPMPKATFYGWSKYQFLIRILYENNNYQTLFTGL